jgi:cytoskeletal protein RodZ
MKMNCPHHLQLDYKQELEKQIIVQEKNATGENKTCGYGNCNKSEDKTSSFSSPVVYIFLLALLSIVLVISLRYNFYLAKLLKENKMIRQSNKSISTENNVESARTVEAMYEYIQINSPPKSDVDDSSINNKIANVAERTSCVYAEVNLKQKAEDRAK